MLGTNEILASKHDIAALKVKHRLRAVSYFSLQSCCTRNPSTRAAINEGVSPRRKNETADSSVLSGDNETVKVNLINQLNRT